MQPQEGPGSEPGSARGPGPQMMGPDPPTIACVRCETRLTDLGWGGPAGSTGGGQGGLGLTLRNDVNGDLRVG
eukprot:3533735-Rhodomonas_salina.2